MSTHSNPYIGPRPFKKDEADRFFGREREARDLLALVSSQRLVLFYASSGAGKSSLINARLIHALTDRGFEVLPVGRVTGMLPSETGIDLANANVFAYLLKQSLAEYALTGALSEADQSFFREYADASLSEFLLRLAHVGQDEQGDERYVFTAASPADAEIAAPPPEDAAVELKPRALIIDQFEEIFTTNLHAWEQRGDFFSQIRQAMEDDPYLWIVLAMREDFIANLDPLAHLLPGDLHARYYMQRMGYNAALEAVKKPVSNPEHREWFRPFPSRVAERLVDNLCLVRVTTEDGKNMAPVKGEFIEPVQLQVVCYQLWEQLRDTPGATITNADLDRLAGGQDLSIFVDRALSEFYEQVLRRVLDKAGDQVDEMELRRWFSERLITEAGTRSFVYRGESETGGLPNEVVRLIAAEFLIRSESRAGGAWYELSHDRFVDPIRRSNQRWSLEQLQRDPLLRRAHEWAASNPSDPGQRDQRLLLNDDELAALDLAGRPVEPVMHDFLEASQQAKKDRDLAAARQQQQAALQRERTARRLLWAFAGLLMVALLATVVAGWQWNDAKTAEATAVAAQTVSAANEAAAKTAEATAVAAQTVSAANEATAKTAEAKAAAALEIARSLELANQSLDTFSPEDKLLLARAANAYTSTLLANTALLAALDYSYRPDNGEMTAAYVPHRSLDFADGGPWAAIAFSNDGHLLALGDNEGGITLWNNATGEAIGSRLVAHGAYPVSALAFDPRGPRMLSATGDRNDPAAARHDLVLWDLSDPARPTPRVLAAQQPAIWSAAWSPDGRMLAVANQDGTVDLWENLSSDEPISRTLPGRHEDWAYSVAFSPNGDRLASAGRDDQIILWSDLASSAPLSQTLTGHTAWVKVVAFSPDGTRLASGSDDGTLRLWDLTADPIMGVVRDNHYDQDIEVWDLAFSADDRRLAAGWGDNRVRIYDLAQPDAAPWELAGHGGEVMALAFDPAAPQRLVFLGLGDAAPLAWDLSQRSEFATTQPFTAPISATLHSIATAGRWLAVSGGSADSQTAFIGDSMSSSPAITLPTGMAITAAALSAGGQRLALAGCKAGS
ncbi:MAG TPA: WD40 repeat domain-containing protein, partial [Anaerolineae bacterium]|nr:WD40 repeat domain-containing protein [Anaerolineae bacterium]